MARHAAEKVSAGALFTLLKVALATLTGVHGASDAIVDLGLNLPNSRRAEREADTIGLMLMARACYDTAAAPRVFEKLGKLHGSGGDPPAWLSTHPPSGERVRALRAVAGDAAREQALAGCEDVRGAMGAAGLRW